MPTKEQVKFNKEMAAIWNDWQPISTAPKDGTRFLAWCVDTVDEENEDGHVIERGKKDAYACIAYGIEWLGSGFVQFPWTGSIVQNREFTHWMPLPDGPR